MRTKIRRSLAMLLSLTMLTALMPAALADELDSADTPAVCTEDCTLDAGHEGACMTAQPMLLDDAPADEGEKETAVAKIGEKTYPSLEAALKAADAGDVSITLLDDAFLNVSDAYIQLGTEKTNSITIDGQDKYTFTMETNYWSRISLKNPNATLALKDVTVTSTQKDGTWNSYDVTFWNCNVDLQNVVFNKAVALDNPGKTSRLKHVAIHESHDYYALWVVAGGNVTAEDCRFVSEGRGIKIADEYVKEPKLTTLSISDTAISSKKKAAILVTSTAGADITIKNVDLSNVKADSVNAVWVDEDRLDYYDLVSVSGGSKFPEAQVAIVGSAFCKTLAKAVETAASGATITLLSDVTEDVTIPSDKTITLDLNGKTLTNSGTSDTISNYGDLTITGNGTVDNITNGKGAVVNYSGGKVALEGATMTRSAEKKGNSWYTVKNMGTFTVEDGTITTGKDGSGNSSLIANGWYYGNANPNNSAVDRNTTHTGDSLAVLTINKGFFSGGMNIIKNDDWSKATINGGTFTNTTGPVILNWNLATINDGEFDGSFDCLLSNGYCGAASDQGLLTITGGTLLPLPMRTCLPVKKPRPMFPLRSILLQRSR